MPRHLHSTGARLRTTPLNHGLSLQERQLREAADTAAAVGSAVALEEAQQRERALTSALAEARASLANMQKLQERSQNQLWSIQVRES